MRRTLLLASMIGAALLAIGAASAQQLAPERTLDELRQDNPHEHFGVRGNHPTRWLLASNAALVDSCSVQYCNPSDTSSGSFHNMS